MRASIEADDAVGGGTEGHADADLAAPLLHGVGRDAVDAERGEQEGDQGEGRRASVTLNRRGAIAASTYARKSVSPAGAHRGIHLAQQSEKGRREGGRVAPQTNRPELGRGGERRGVRMDLASLR